MTARFASPFDVSAPAGAEGWEQMYPYYLLFSAENRDYEDSVLWFRDGMHHPQVQPPFDTIIGECWRIALGQYNTRIFAVPPAYGIDQRILNGYLYIAPVPVSSAEWMQERRAIFIQRAGHYYRNWDQLFGQWKAKMRALIDELKALDVPRLPRLDDQAVVTQARGVSTGHRLLAAYDAMIEIIFRGWQHHFEMLNLGYAAYFNLFASCRRSFPGIRDEAMAQLVAGSDMLFFRPDDELKRLARLATDLGIAGLLRAPESPEAIVASLAGDPRGRRWVNAFEAAKDPWFCFSSGTGFYHHERSWIDDLTVPWAALTRYLDKLEAGESLERPTRQIAERRDRLADGYRALLDTEADRAAFDQDLSLARMVAPYIEDHNFYVEHWFHTVFWEKVRLFGDRLVAGGILGDREDVFMLNRWEVGHALYELVAGWAVGAPVRGRRYWPPVVAERRRILGVLHQWQAPEAVGPVPGEITEPFTVMLWGITTERVRSWLSGADSDDSVVNGVAGSPGVAEGAARVIRSAAQLGEIELGEILVCPITAPAWGPIFSRISAAVSDIGGVMSHAAIVSREYGLPAVVGTGKGTQVIKTGDRIRVDGGTGKVTILARGDDTGRADA